MQIEEALSAYTTQLVADGRARNTIDQIRRHGRLFVGWIGSTTKIEDVTHEHVARFLASDLVQRRADGGRRKPSSGNALRSSLRTFLGFCHAAGYTSTNAGRLIRRARTGASMPKALDDEDRARLVEALDGASTPMEQRDRVLFTLLISAGPRIGSTLGADVEDFDAKAGTIYLRSTKTGADATVFLPRATVDLLREYIGTRTSGPLFTNANGTRLGPRQAHRRLATWAKRAGITRACGPHTLRHSFAVALLRKTSNVVVVGRALSHRSLSATLVYTRCSDAEVRSAVGA